MSSRPNTVSSGRGDGGMIFNTNDLEVAPPLKQALAVRENRKQSEVENMIFY